MALAKDKRTSAPRQVSRRNLLSAAPAFGLAGLMAGTVPVAAQAETPIAALYRKWDAQSKLVDAASADRDLPDEEFDRVINLQTDMEDEIAKLPAQDLRDFVMKIFARSSGGTMELPSAEACPQLWAEARALIAA